MQGIVDKQRVEKIGQKWKASTWVASSREVYYMFNVGAYGLRECDQKDMKSLFCGHG